MSSVDSNPPSLLEVKDLHVYFPIRGGVMRRQLHTVKAVSGVSQAILAWILMEHRRLPAPELMEKINQE